MEKKMTIDQDTVNQQDLTEVPDSSLSGSEKINFPRLAKISIDHHQALLILQAHYQQTYGEKVPLTWLLYRILEGYFKDDQHCYPRHPILDVIKEKCPPGRPLPGGLFEDLSAFMLFTSGEKIKDSPQPMNHEPGA